MTSERRKYALCPINPASYREHLIHTLDLPRNDIVPDITNYIDKGKLAAAGTYGQVYEGRWKGVKESIADDRLILPTVAVKVLRLPKLQVKDEESQQYEKIKHEFEIWSRINHDNILPLIGIARFDDNPNVPAFISPWIEDGTVTEYLKRHPDHPPIGFLHDIIEGLYYLHTFNPEIVHGDIKAVNVLVNYRKEAYICDFGVSRFAEENTLCGTSSNSAVGTIRWMAPELHLGEEKSPTKASDIFAYGMTCWEILAGQVPFEPLKFESAVSLKIMKNLRPERVLLRHPDAFWEIITRCWAHEPSSRPDTDAVLRLVRVAVTQIVNTDKTDTRSSNQAKIMGANKGLESDVDKIVKICPRFRILIIGKAGVGKTSLIRCAFGVKDATVFHHQSGTADIDREFTSKDNERFVLHDSMGFEPGDERNFEKVRKFIERRKNMAELKDRLHAVWICFDTPRAGDRLLETASEEFLKLKSNGALRDIPVIAVFTKYDNLVARVWLNMKRSQKSTAGEAVNDVATEIFRTSCATLIEQLDRISVPHIAVSTKPAYGETLSELLNLTSENVTQHVSKTVSLVSAIAQRVSPELKIEESMAVGAKRYWSGLASGANFRGYTIKECLAIVHNDIVKIWNFNDEYKYLHSKEFRQMMMGMADDAPNSNGEGNSRTTFTASILSAASIMGNFSFIRAFIFVGGLSVCQWAYDVFANTNTVLRRFMTYIVDLTLVMQTLFGLVAGSQKSLIRRAIKQAYHHYRNSKEKNCIHTEVEEHTMSATFWRIMDRDYALEMIVEIIRRYPLQSEELTTLRMKNKGVLEQHDEAWQ